MPWGAGWPRHQLRYNNDICTRWLKHPGEEKVVSLLLHVPPPQMASQPGRWVLSKDYSCSMLDPSRFIKKLEVFLQRKTNISGLLICMCVWNRWRELAREQGRLKTTPVSIIWSSAQHHHMQYNHESHFRIRVIKRKKYELLPKFCEKVYINYLTADTSFPLYMNRRNLHRF